MTVDNVTIVWAMIILSFGLMGVMIAFIYYGSRNSKNSKR